MNRVEVRQIVANISSYNPFTTYEIENEYLILRAVFGMLTRSQIVLADKYESEIIQYFQTKPPDSQCRNGHPVKWQLTKYGVWVCACYLNPKPIIIKQSACNGVVNYWEQKRG